MTVTEVRIQPTDNDDDDGPIHIACCVAHVALCGYDLDGPGMVVQVDRDELCVVCDDLETTAYHFCPVMPVCVKWKEAPK